jgi:uncharacterized protein YndB with AHSA1/START domain
MIPDDPAPAVVIRRLIAAPRERVFAAWLDPVSVAKWMRPGDVAGVTAEIDARVGGAFRIVMSHGRGDPEHWGEYIAIDPPSFLSFTWASAKTNREPTLVTIEFHEKDGGTELVLTHRGLPERQIEPHRKGWGDIVRKLGESLTLA